MIVHTITQRFHLTFEQQSHILEPMAVLNENPLADAKYLGPANSWDVDIVVDSTVDGPAFASVIATPIMPKVLSVTRTYTIPPPPDSYGMKRRRKQDAVRAGIIGAVVGLVICGPVGALLVGLGSAHVSKRMNKKKEKQIWMAYDLKVAQQMDVAIVMERNPAKATTQHGD